MFVFHIGLAKTGTSTIQGTMAANAERLRVRGILYPVVSNRGSKFAHQILSQNLKGKGGIHAPAWEAVRALRDEARDKTVLLSSEGFSGCRPELAKEAIGGGEARVIVYLRDYAAWAVSSYCQLAKLGETALSFDDYLTAKGDGRIDRIPERLLDWAEVFGRDHVRIRSLDSKTLVNGRIVDDFLAALGTSPEGLVIPPNVNETPDWRVVELLKERHARNGTRAGLDATAPTPKRVLDAGLAAGRRLGWKERAEYLTRDQRRALGGQYRVDRERLMTAIPDCRLADLTIGLDSERPFLPSPETVSLADRRAFEAAFAEAQAEPARAFPVQWRSRLVRSLKRVVGRVGA